MGIGEVHLQAGLGLAAKSEQEIWLAQGEFIREDLGEGTAEVRGNGNVVHLGQAFVDTDVTEIAIEEGEADGYTIVDGIELGEALGGESFKAQGQARVGGWGAGH